MVALVLFVAVIVFGAAGVFDTATSFNVKILFMAILVRVGDIIATLATVIVATMFFHVFDHPVKFKFAVGSKRYMLES